MNEYEKQEIQNYDGQIYYLGQNCKNKLKGHAIKLVSNTAVVARRPSYLRRQSQASAQQSAAQSAQLIPSERQVERLKQMNIYNYGYDDDNGDYQTVLKDHIGYRYEVLDFIGSGSFG